MSTLPRDDFDWSSELSFEDLIYPISPDRFLAEYWGKAPLVVRRKCPEYYGKLFSLADVDASLMAAASSSGNVLHVIAPPASKRTSAQTLVSAVSTDALYDAFNAGDTVRLIGVDRFWPPVRRLLAVLQEVIEGTAGVNFFLTPAHSQAFPMHFDTMDGFILQVAGSKRWQIWEQTYERPPHLLLSEKQITPLMEKDESKLTLREDLVLESGDLLYLPRGFYHKALALDELSLHLTISVRPITWIDFFRRALSFAALSDIELRQDLPNGFVTNPRVQESMRSTFVQLLQRFSEKFSFEQTLDEMVDQQVVARPFPPDGHFAVLAQAQEITAGSWVEKRKGLACLVEETAEHAVIRFANRRVQGPRLLLPALEYVRDHERFSANDLPGAITPEGKLTLVRRLIRDGLLRPAVS